MKTWQKESLMDINMYYRVLEKLDNPNSIYFTQVFNEKLDSVSLQRFVTEVFREDRLTSADNSAYFIGFDYETTLKDAKDAYEKQAKYELGDLDIDTGGNPQEPNCQ